jgi:hypothetical protein
MLALNKEDITKLFIWLDDSLPNSKKDSMGGRPSKLRDSELLAILLWNALTVKQKTLKDVYRWIRMEYEKEFPQLPCYENFVRHIHRTLPSLIFVLNSLLDSTAPIRIMDSTMLPVCRLVRADSHKVAKDKASFGKNHQGWHYGFKLHMSIDPQGRIAGLVFTPANQADNMQMKRILNRFARVAVGDGGYTASRMQRAVWEKYGTIIISPPHPRQRKKVMAFWQHRLLLKRPKIESVFDYLKEHMHLVSSFPRSVKGYLVHYVRILLGYQIMACS